MLDNDVINKLVNQAVSAANNSYSPYSHFKVGAALLCDDGTVYLGTNIENSSYSATVCAERTAFFSAINDGKRNFAAIAIAGGSQIVGQKICPPCGVCRQVMAEFCNPDTFTVLLVKQDGAKQYLLRDLLPLSFSL